MYGIGINMNIHLATDHAGYAHKEVLKKYLLDSGIEVVDHGATTVVEDDDYPDFMTPCAQAVADDTQSFGIIFGGSGQGEAMCANRVTGVRAVVYYGGSKDILTLSREHNNANILSIGARFVSPKETIEAVKLWLATPFSAEARHVRRLSKF
jgi:ribose 5-phosphate isomerase B